MPKKIAVIVRDRQAEAFRMALGLTLEDDEVTIFLMDNKVNTADKGISMSIEMCQELKVRMFSNEPANSFQFMTTEDIARSLVNYDTVLPY